VSALCHKRPTHRSKQHLYSIASLAALGMNISLNLMDGITGKFAIAGIDIAQSAHR